MTKLEHLLACISSVIALQVYGGSADTLGINDHIQLVDSTGNHTTGRDIPGDTVESYRYSSVHPIGENGPVNVFSIPETKYGKLVNGPGDASLNIMEADSVAASADSLKPKWYNTRLVRSSIFPMALIGYSLTVMKDNGLYSSYDAKRDIRKAFGSYRSPVDDYLIWAPYAELGVLNLFKIRCKTDALNTSLLILKSELIMTAIVFPVKQFSHQLRPDSSNFESFPSGHTANAFVAASVVHKEYRHLSAWYGVGAYTIATSVAAFRMINNKHWQSDVIAGAGIGLLATHIAYATHRYRWGRKDVCFVPTIGKGSYGGAMVYQF